MKKFLGMALAGAAMLALSGCAGEGVDNGGGMDTHFLTDVNGVGIPGVSYDCSNSSSGTTGPDGSYGFETGGDNCTFRFNSHVTDQPLYIKQGEHGAGVSGLYYSCTYDTGSVNTPYSGWTGSHGHIKHVWYDAGWVIDTCTIRY